MAIQINLLAEQQAAEEMRRRDPVKRATWFTGFVIGLFLVWGGYLQFRLMRATGEVTRCEGEWKALEKEYSQVTSNIERTAQATNRISALQTLATTRFLWASALNALQYSLVDNVQIVRLKVDQTYSITEAIKPSTNATTGVVSRGRPATSREKIILTMDAKDYSSKPGDQIQKFKEKLISEPYFKTNLQRSELMGQSPPQPDTAVPSRSYVQFTLECQFKDQVR